MLNPVLNKLSGLISFALMTITHLRFLELMKQYQSEELSVSFKISYGATILIPGCCEYKKGFTQTF